MSVAAIKVPTGLSREARQLWMDVQNEFVVESAPARMLLLIACHSLDRLRSAQKAIKSDGITVKNRYGMPVPHPALRIEVQSRNSLMVALGKIGFQGELSDG